jgi:ABC-type nickel/cobalt efflux system permease component RcnA
MTSFTDYLQHGNAWLFVPVAIVLGILHGFEPGHSKTMMAAFIIVIRGTVTQAILLGVAATVSHTAIIWILAGIGLHYSKDIDAEKLEPYFEVVTGAIVFAMAAWVFTRTRREEKERSIYEETMAAERAHSQRSTPAPAAVVASAAAPAASPMDGEICLIPFQRRLSAPLQRQAHQHEHDTAHGFGDEPGHSHDHDHAHAEGNGSPLILASSAAAPTSGTGLIWTPDETAPGSLASASPVSASNPTKPTYGSGPHGGKMLDTGHGWLEISILDASAGGGPRFRVFPFKRPGQPAAMPHGTTVEIETSRLDGSQRTFLFDVRETFWESTAELPTPHDFAAVVKMIHSNHVHSYRLRFTSDPSKPSPALDALAPPSEEEGEYQDAHQRAHADEIKECFANRAVTTWQVVLFGLTGGLMPCSAALTVLLMCLQAKQFFLGAMIVTAFSIGLAITLVAFGTVAALSVKIASTRLKNFDSIARKMPYASSVLMALIGLVIAAQGVQGLMH